MAYVDDTLFLDTSRIKMARYDRKTRRLRIYWGDAPVSEDSATVLNGDEAETVWDRIQEEFGDEFESPSDGPASTKIPD